LKGRKNMKIAAVSDDGRTISRHFGRASLYVVLSVEDGKIAGKETRPKAGHGACDGAERHHAPGEACSCDSASQAKHRTMADTIADCQILMAGGMGLGAYDSLKSYGIEPVVTNLESIDQAAQMYLAGELANMMDRLH
jgi:predicted Fe-Mo cluster-binding NifX family protein